MRVRESLFAAAAAIALSVPAFAQRAVELTGTILAGQVLEYRDVDVLVYDLKVKRNNQVADQSLTIRVYNGQITVGRSYSDIGIDASGENGADGNPCAQLGYTPTSGRAGMPGMAVILETLPLNARPLVTVTPAPEPSPLPILEPLPEIASSGREARELNITVIGSILASGGNGGNGRPGCAEHALPPEQNCALYGAQNASSPGFGADGGSVTINSSGNIAISGGISVNGGNGGNGANGGEGNTDGPGNATAGAPGGAAGIISIAHTRYARETATCDFFSGSYTCGPNTCHYAGRLNGNGGNGGFGGNGAGGNGVTHGAPGGAGGRGSKLISLNVRAFSASGNPIVGCQISADGGSGGTGGDGGYGSSPGWRYWGDCTLDCDLPAGEQCCRRFFITVYPGGNAGVPGAGGAGGRINVSALRTFTVNQYVGITATGARGGDAGQARGPGSGHTSCNPACTTCPSVQTAGQIANGAPGGAGGRITIKAGSTFNAYTAWFAVHGGEGGTGSFGIDSVPVCRRRDSAPCPPDICCFGPLIVCGSSAPRPGGNGGLGGAGGTISISGQIVTDATYSYCGGLGGFGRNGGAGILHWVEGYIQWDTSGAPGGSAGNNGLGGTLIRTGFPTLYCEPTPPDPTRFGNPGGQGPGCIES